MLLGVTHVSPLNSLTMEVARLALLIELLTWAFQLKFCLKVTPKNFASLLGWITSSPLVSACLVKTIRSVFSADSSKLLDLTYAWILSSHSWKFASELRLHFFAAHTVCQIANSSAYRDMLKSERTTLWM